MRVADFDDKDFWPDDGYGREPAAPMPAPKADNDLEPPAWIREVPLHGDPLQVPAPITATPFTWRPEAEIPPRKWLYGKHLLRRFVSVLWLHRLRQPTLVLTGESDPIIPVANGRVLAGRIPGARLEVVPGGHLFILTHPGRTAARVNSFLDDPAL